ncbi:glycoside hydrolase family 31 protein [Trichoderma atroviride IMI 206040]|uniref:alpha-glucosidase n=1 Tax=Hypocrea atroviridis (strain ATCC 20476 / IMI 206040) TaxID=452589 RepID=G9P7D9_HYPAI|nr:glycoside hydrolase family 31 protein [Trichoderma atroviride IMI 206040]EHK42301.1 glycoside hydrolase family 31 protein [Trichoderma atroviride IMI 206040]
MTDFDEIKDRDPYTFIPADEFFNHFDNDLFDSCIRQPERASFDEADQPKIQINGEARNVFRYGKIFRLHEQLEGEPDEESLLLIEFVRPQVWRIRFNPAAASKCSFKDENSRAIACPSMSELITKLDGFEGLDWRVELISTVPSYYILQSVKAGAEKPEVQLWIQKSPFQITAIRPVKNSRIVEKFSMPSTIDEAIRSQVDLQPIQGVEKAVIWKTKPKPIKYVSRGSATILSVEAPATAHYMGFGEQGGRNLFKSNTYMNYFNFDNMKYQNVYGNGPLDEREPLYHTEPFWMEVASHIGFQSVLATMIDNYSHTCLDVRKTHQRTIRTATRFNEFNCMIVAADRISELLNVYTSIVGKPSLKPRYVLGYHQGCYGYDTKEAVLQCAQNYRDAQFPLDAIHIDVDIQREHKTFTIDDRPGHFPQPKEMFDTLRRQGVKCCTNITPHINSAQDPEYTTLNELLENNYYVEDRRDLAKSDLRPWQDRYHYWDYGRRVVTNPSETRPDYRIPDETDLSVTYNAGKPFRGGVYYGWGNGAPGYYPNLNNHEVREWWGKQFKYLFECGVEFIWQDMTSPCIAPEYGDMKSFPFRLLLDSDTRLDESYEEVAVKRKAIEIWALYSYNLYEATFNGLQNLHLSNELAWRKGRRNFIIGRGSYIGSHKFAGLWTGDNASTWDFLSTSVVQVLGLGLSGNAISGQDVGGFEFIEPDHNWANPELLIRWYGAYSLLPWFRNHYTKKDGKQFQEPYAYDQHYRDNMHHFHDPREAFLFRAVLPVCRYYVRLRYSLMQLLYDAMFENAVTGMPVARSMIITDDQDATLFFENKWFANDQYLVGNDILVAPPLRAEAFFDRHEVYLPYPDEWFPINLYPDEPLGTALNPAIGGGSRIFCKCNISLEDDHIPRITPMYIREGAIIPKIETRMSTPDWYPNGYPGAESEMKAPEANPITFHVYPGKDNTYTMYIDDGISTDSEPLSKIPNLTDEPKPDADKYCEVRIKQVSTYSNPRNENVLYQCPNTDQVTMINTEEKCTRVLTIEAIQNGYDKYKQIVGGEYKVVFWHKESAYSNDIVVGGSLGPISVQHLERIRATVVKFATDVVHVKGGITITLIYDN